LAALSYDGPVAGGDKHAGLDIGLNWLSDVDAGFNLIPSDVVVEKVVILGFVGLVWQAFDLFPPEHQPLSDDTLRENE